MRLEITLTRLEEAQLLRHLVGSEAAFAFQHALTHETAYSSLLRKRRSEIHRTVAQAYEELFAGRLEEEAALLARHYSEAGDDAKTLRFARMAGDAAARVYAHTEAILHYAQALEIAARTGAPATDLIYLSLARGRSLELSGDFAAALRSYEQLEAEGEKRGERPIVLASLIARAGIYATPNPAHDPAKGQLLLERALALARELADRAAEARVLWIFMLLHSFQGHTREAMPYGEQALAVARALDLREQTAFTLNGLFMVYWPIGEAQKAEAVIREALELWPTLDNPAMLAEANARYSLVQFAEGNYEKAIACSDEAFRVSESASHVWGQANSRTMLGHVYLDRGEIGRAITVMEEAVRLGEQVRHPAALISTRADLGWAYGSAGAVSHGLALAQKAVETARAAYRPLLPWALGVRARLLVLAGDLAAAADAFQEASRSLAPEGSFHSAIWVYLADAEIGLAQEDAGRTLAATDALAAYLVKSGWRPFMADALYLKGQALALRGCRDEAYAAWTEAHTRAEALGTRRILWPVLAALADAEAARGNPQAVAERLDRARAIVTSILDQIGDLPWPGAEDRSLRDAFAALPDVRRLLGS